MPQLQSVKAVGLFPPPPLFFFLFVFSLKDVICKMGIIYGFGVWGFFIPDCMYCKEDLYIQL